MTSPAAIKQSDVSKVIKAYRSAGVYEFRMEVDFVNGKVNVWPGQGDDTQTPNPCDRLLK